MLQCKLYSSVDYLYSLLYNTINILKHRLRIIVNLVMNVLYTSICCVCECVCACSFLYLCAYILMNKTCFDVNNSVVTYLIAPTPAATSDENILLGEFHKFTIANRWNPPQRCVTQNDQ